MGTEPFYLTTRLQTDGQGDSKLIAWGIINKIE